MRLFSLIKLKLLVPAALCCSTTVLAQEQVTDTIQVFEQQVIINPVDETFPKFKFGGVFQGRYIDNFKKDVDIDGLHHSDGEGTSNSFDVKRMRVSLAARITENLEVITLVNLADSKDEKVTNKILENAYAKYTFNRYFQVQIGQFRPLFGMEETYPVDIVKALDYSNSYYLFGSNGWMSFQVGAAITGSVDLGKVPMSYGLSVTNGNGKNKTDNDNGKHYSSRLLFNLDKTHNFNVGVSGGIAEVKKEKSYAVGVEATLKVPLTDRLSMDFQTEAKQGTNHNAFFRVPEDIRIDKLDDYVMKSFYILPNIRYEVGKKHFQAIEFACRYEYLDENSKLNSNARQTFTPMLSLEFLKNYGARIQVGMQIDNYKENIKDTKMYNSNLAFIQFQCRL
ncbi:porin [Myroides injenensis]|uniref:porin n=1 Tax=Myroides injenensis TaxID=1183151 RepID=UPI0022702916|nr:porin [Myroides injenensis]